MHEDNASIGLSPLRSDIRGRGYDRELLASIDAARGTGVVSENSPKTVVSLLKSELFP